jgi:hypothetical protein
MHGKLGKLQGITGRSRNKEKGAQAIQRSASAQDAPAGEDGDGKSGMNWIPAAQSEPEPVHPCHAFRAMRVSLTFVESVL